MSQNTLIRTKQKASSGTPQHLHQSLEHQLMLETPASILPPGSMVSASPTTPVPPEAPDLPEEAKPEEEKNDSAIGEDPVTED